MAVDLGPQFPRLENGYIWSLPPPGLLEWTNGGLIIWGGMTCTLTVHQALQANSYYYMYPPPFTQRWPSACLLYRAGN